MFRKKKHLMFAGSFLIFLGEIMVFFQKKKKKNIIFPDEIPTFFQVEYVLWCFFCSRLKSISLLLGSLQSLKQIPIFFA